MPGELEGLARDQKEEVEVEEEQQQQQKDKEGDRGEGETGSNWLASENVYVSFVEWDKQIKCSVSKNLHHGESYWFTQPHWLT